MIGINIGATTSEVRTVITYTDNSTDTVDTTGAAAGVFLILGGLFISVTVGITVPTLIPGMATKPVKSIACTTLGAGVNARTVAITCRQVGT